MEIAATISKNSYQEDKVREIVRAGASMLRYNLSHGEPSQIQERFETARRAIAAEGKQVSIIADLPGNKMRLGSFEPNQIHVEAGDSFTFVSGAGTDSLRTIAIDASNVSSLVTEGSQMFVGDGELSFRVERIIDESSFTAVAENAGQLVTFSGITIPGPSIDTKDHVTEKTLAHIGNLKNLEPEIVAFSFVRSKEDVQRLKELVHAAWPEGDPLLMAKIESPLGVQNIDEIADAVDWVMVARGDLALTTPFYALGMHERAIIEACKARGKKVMVATQVLSSLVESYLPTRPEITSLTNSVIAGVDAVLLTKETGVSATPGHSVEVASKIINYVQQRLQ